MSRRANRYSIFAQGLDRAVFLAYFLGAVVPLAALGYVFVRPALESSFGDSSWLDDVGSLARLGVLASSGLLCLVSFWILRRFAGTSLARMAVDRERLARLVDVSGKMADAPHAGEVARMVAEAALGVTEARASYVLLAGEKETPLELVQHAGVEAEAIYTRAARAIEAMGTLALDGGRPALVGQDGGRSPDAGLAAAAAVPLPGSGAGRGVLVVVHVEDGKAFDTQHVGSLSTLASIAAVAVHNADLKDSQQNFFAHVTELLVSALDAYLDFHVGHSRRVAHYSNAVGREVGLDDQRLQKLHFASLLHDIGMLRIDRDEWPLPSAHRKHPGFGARMLERIQLWEDIAPFVLHHHEWWDGQGYPEGLAGAAIPQEARIIGIAEAFDSMTTASYRGQIETEEALRRVESGAGTQFDPELAAVFVRLVREGAIRLDS